jgi:hypothetical protein
MDGGQPPIWGGAAFGFCVGVTLGLLLSGMSIVEGSIIGAFVGAFLGIGSRFVAALIERMRR